MSWFERIRSERGDTIVEVLIAITVVSSVLVGAYQTTRSNTATSQDTQEHGVALGYAEAQLEALQNSSDPYTAGLGNCFNPSDVTIGVVSGTACTISPVSGGAAYNVQIIPPTGSITSYEAVVTWDSLKGGQDNVSLYYRPEAKS